MEKMYADPNMENDNTEPIKGKRLSSILKAPRNPLDDLGNGNELTQDINIQKRRKNSRRVSFANTINCRVFQQDLKNNTAENAEGAADTGSDVLLNQNEEPEAVPCEITGMNTLLHAPIQAAVQQTEEHDVDNAFQRTTRHDTTLIFADENEMDMTSSHTAVITRNLKDNQADETEKIDVTSFLAGLSSSNAKTEGSKEFQFFSDPTADSCSSLEQKEGVTPVKKINFNEFLKSLKSNEKAPNPIEGPDKENVFCDPSQVSEDVARSSAEFAYFHEPLDTSNVTKVFRGQDDGMEMTKCQASDVRAVFAGTCEAPPQQFPTADVTAAFADDGMDITASHTAKVSFPFSSVGNQSLNFKKDFPSTELDNSVLKTASNQHLIVQHNPPLCTDRRTVPVEDRRDPTALRIVKQEARAMSAIPGSISSETVFRGDKTLLFSKCGDMEMTGNYTNVISNASTKEMNSSPHKTFDNAVNTNSLLAENRPPSLGDRDVTESLTSSDNRAPVSYKPGALQLSLGSDEQIENLTQDRGAASMDVGFDSCASSVSAGVSKSKLQHRAGNFHLVSLPGEKTVIFSGEDMDLTKTCIAKGDGRNVENEFPVGGFSSVTSKPHFLSDRSTFLNLNEQEEMEITKCHAVVIDDQNNGTAAEAKQLHCKIVPRENQNKSVSGGTNSLDMDKENLEVISIGGSIKRSQISKDLEGIMIDKKLGKSNFQSGGLSSCAKSVCSLQEQRREVPQNIVTDACPFVSLQSQKVAKSQPLEKPLLNASISCTSDKMDVFSDDQRMDMTKTRPTAFGVALVNTGQEYEHNCNQNNVTSKQLRSQTLQCSGGSGVDITSLKMNPNKQTVTPLAPSGSCISSNEPAPSAVNRNTQPGAMLGINAGCQNSDRQEKTHALKVGNKTLPTRADPEGDFSVGTRGEKSVVFPAGENMDLTGNCVVMVPDYDVSAALSEGKAVPGYLVQEENKITSLKKGTLMTLNSQEQPVCEVYSLVSGKKALTTSGLKHLPFAGEKTTIFSADADMDITRSHTVSADKMILQHKSSNDDTSLISGDKTCIFTYNDNMEISRLDKSMEKAASQGTFNMAKRTGRKSLKGTAGEKTVLFSPGNENHDIEITESHTAAIGLEIVSQNTGGLPSDLSVPVKTVLFTSSRADMDMTQSCSAHKIPVKVACEDDPQSGAAVGQRGLSSREGTVCAEDDMEITKTHNAALGENSLQGRQPSRSVPLTSTIMFTSYQADMEITQSHSVDESIGRVFREDRCDLEKRVGQEAAPGSRTILFPSSEDMEITKTHAAVLGGEIGARKREPVPACSAAPADKTVMFSHNQGDMEITASHTIFVNNNVRGFENQEVPRKSARQPDPRSTLLSSCRGKVDASRTKDLNGECHTNSKDKPNIPSSASSAPAFPGEKGTIKVPSGTPPDSIYSVLLPEEAVAVQTPQDLAPPADTSVPVSSEQDLVPPVNLEAKSESFKLPSSGPLDGGEESDLVSRVSLPAQQPHSLMSSSDKCGAWGTQVLKEESSPDEDLGTDFGLAGVSRLPVSNREPEEKEGLSAEGETPPKDLQINSEQTKQLWVSDSPRDQTDPTLAPDLLGILNVCSKLKNIRRKSTVFSVSETASSDQFPKSSVQPEDTLRLEKNTVNEPNNLFDTKEQENTCLESGAAPMDTNVHVALEGKYQGLKVPLGIFQPKLPNRRNPSASSVQDINTKPSDKGEAPVSEVSVNPGETPGTNKPIRQNFSPSKFIAEEFLPICLEEMDSNESVSSELVENSCRERSKTQIPHNKKNQSEETKACNTKRALEQDEEDLQSPKKVKRDENLDGEASQDLQVTFGPISQSQVEVHEGEDPPNVSAKSPDGTHGSASSSLDSVKADTELTIQPSSQMESQLLTDSICEDTLREKLQTGVITVGEFLTLLQVHVPIQKPRHSRIPASCAVSAPPTPEDLIYSQYVYRPKVRIYEEDCQALSQKIEELKLCVNVQDQLLVNVNKSLWEVMRTCSDKELRNFGAELNKMKSYFTKESKILAHQEKETLYSKLVQSAQEQQEKLQSRIEKVDELLKEAESCLLALEPDSNWEEWEANCSDEMAQEKKLEEELENVKAQEEELKRELSDLEAENEQILAEINQLKEKERSYQDLLERCDFTEWEITEWSEQQAVFNFLYDSLELTVVFGPPIDGDDFGEDPSRSIVSLNFESLLDEEEAPPSSCLVHRLIFQFIESQGCWQEKCPTLYYLRQVLQDVSLVVSQCKILGEEIEFLERWGGKFNLLKTDISDTKVKLLFSASRAFAKFELTLSLSATYPAAPLPFTVQKHIGNIGEKEISAVLSEVPAGYHYLQRIVSSVHQHLLQDPR